MKHIERRKLLRTAAGLASVAAVGSTAGCLDSAPSTAESSDVLDAIPAGADAVAYANVDTIRQDEGVKTLTNTHLEQRSQYEYYDGPEDFDGLLGHIEDEWETDPSNVHEATVFSEFGGTDDELFAEYGGVVLRADLEAEDVKRGLENVENIDFSEVEHSGSVVYEPESADGRWVGSLSTDRVVVGTEDAVYDAIDVQNGDSDTIDSEVENAYTETRDAPVRFAGRMPSPSDNPAVPESVAKRSDEPIDLTPLDDVDTLRGSVYRDDDVRGLETTLAASDRDAAADATDVVTELRDRAQSSIPYGSVADLVGDISVEQDGSSVKASLRKTVSELDSVLEDTYGG
ncbi:hypothetical protein NDI56_10990 [Haloarcula sp. S1CR25-12]|uniref:Uncharacterized protein n=1 Tax=Haloarcula saliterrae TaxID=2950534 RepID=A0ABU2FCC4_9EURY|nr:hypothetical protein [Haloarcula sp. S1CR25-12]MDS0259919.1 hypothetical protein [Haloarcula sp. S1CR25-12]